MAYDLQINTAWFRIRIEFHEALSDRSDLRTSADVAWAPVDCIDRCR
jgi:hypothetical protein